MVNFATPTPTYSTKRNYEPITDFEDFCAVKDTFLDDQTMNLAEKELKSESYTGVINISYGGEVKATIKISTKDETGFANLMDYLCVDDTAEEGYGAGATAARDSDKNNWKLNFSGKTAGGDPFTLAVDESYAVLSGYHTAATCTTVETWADTVTVLSTDPEA